MLLRVAFYSILKTSILSTVKKVSLSRCKKYLIVLYKMKNNYTIIYILTKYELLINTNKQFALLFIL